MEAVIIGQVHRAGEKTQPPVYFFTGRPRTAGVSGGDRAAGQRTEHTSAELPRGLLHQHVLDGVAERAQHQHGPPGRALHLLDPLVGQAQTVWNGDPPAHMKTRHGEKQENDDDGRNPLQTMVVTYIITLLHQRLKQIILARYLKLCVVTSGHFVK